MKTGPYQSAKSSSESATGRPLARRDYTPRRIPDKILQVPAIPTTPSESATIRRPRALLIDLDGVVYQDDVPIEGASEALAWVQAQAIPHAFVTNTSSLPRRTLIDKLAGMGIRVAREEHIVTPPIAAAAWLQREGRSPAALFVPDVVQGDFPGIEALPPGAETGAGAVVLGDLGETWSFAILNRAFRLLQANPDAALVALGMTRYWRAAEGLRLDVGPFVAALESASGRKAVVLGKPARSFFEIALATLECPAAEAVMIGDDIAIDVGGAQQAGMQALLVRTGKFHQNDLAGVIRPDAILNSIADLPAWWRA
jgi:phospholysine phosphohistidine inorganic pyrophosphate phosphatase